MDRILLAVIILALILVGIIVVAFCYSTELGWRVLAIVIIINLLSIILPTKSRY